MKRKIKVEHKLRVPHRIGTTEAKTKAKAQRAQAKRESDLKRGSSWFSKRAEQSTPRHSKLIRGSSRMPAKGDT